MTLSAGDRVDRYEVVELLGRGGMGEVYRARDSRLQRQVALKILRVDGPVATDGRARLLREARAVATLSHPSVLAVFDADEVKEPEHLRGLAYIAMELVVGSALRAYVGDASMPIDRRIGWLEDVAKGLAAAHDAGIVHRDVKPENVMIRFDGAVKVLDFGVARTLARGDALTSTDGQSFPTLRTLEPRGSAPDEMVSPAAQTAPGGVAGTLYYMAPEQLRGEAIDGRADQFAWAVVAHELLTGSPPWSRSSDPIAVASQILSHGLRAPGEIDPRIPGATSRAIARALSKNAADRFPTMHALVAAMASGDASTEGVATARPTPRPEPPAPSRRSPSRMRLARLSGVALVVLGGAAMLVSSRRRHGPELVVAAPHSADATSSLGGCTSSAACSAAHGGAAWRCQSERHECVAMDTPECTTSASAVDLASDDTVWLGALLPTTGPAADDILAERRALDIAQHDFEEALGSSAARPGGLHARPIGLVVCDETKDTVKAAKHLAEDVQTPAVVGFRWPASALATIPTVFLPNHVLSFVTVSQAADLTRIPQTKDEPRLVWRSTLNTADTARPLAALIEHELEPRARALGLGKGPMKVAVVRAASNARDLTNVLFRELRFNGKSALENGDRFRQYVFADDGKVDDALVSALVDFAPHVVVYQGATVVGTVLEPLEQRWRAGPRPMYLVNSEFDLAAAAFAGTDRDRRRRLFGVTNVSATVTNAELVLHYNLAYPREPITRTNAPQPSYDAFYTLAYASEAIGDEPVDGFALSRAFQRLVPPGPRVEVGPQGILDAFQTLRSGGRIDLEGAIGSLDFDPSAGEAPIDYAILCMGAGDDGRAQSAIPSGLVFDSKTRALSGTLRCP